MQQAKIAQALIAFGANLPLGADAPEVTITKARGVLGGQGIDIQKFSQLYRTPCFPAGAGPDYVNAAAVIGFYARVPPGELLAKLHAVEVRFGRERGQRWGMRTLDLDLLAMGDSVLPDVAAQDHWRNLPPDRQARETPDTLILPHPRLQDRAFVLVPLADVAPDWVHPRTGETVRQMLAALPQAERDAVKPL